MITGIYKIRNIINNKIYIGSAVNIKKRWRDHKWYLKENKHHNPHLQSSWNKYGDECFKFDVIKECKKNALLILEKSYIDKYNAFNNEFGYNVNDPENVFLGRKHSEKTKKILSKQKMGSKNPMFGKTGNKHHNFGKNVSEETKQKISKNRKGIVAHYGENNSISKLKENDIFKIRKLNNIDKLSQRKIAVLFNISQPAVFKILHNKTWKHVS